MTDSSSNGRNPELKAWKGFIPWWAAIPITVAFTAMGIFGVVRDGFTWNVGIVWALAIYTAYASLRLWQTQSADH